MFIATLIASGPYRIDAHALDQARDAVVGIGGVPGAPEWIEAEIAVDVAVARVDGASVRAVLEGLLPGIDLVVQPRAGREKRLLVADMDSTMITVECIDELADFAGIKAEVADITDRAMRGELDFEEALDARVGLLKGLDAAVVERCHAERVKIMPGAEPLVRTMRARGGRAVLVSGGFTVFADRVAATIGFDRAVSNRLVIDTGVLAGTVARPIVGADAKRTVLLEERDAAGLDPSAVLAVGDGANDIPMIEAAGLGVAYHAKPKTAAAADARIDRGDLSALLYAQGIPRAHWVF